MKTNESTTEIVAAYHERTKHHYDRSAASLGYLDWATQLDPFRRYEGAPLSRLPLPPEGRELPYWPLYIIEGRVSPVAARGVGPLCFCLREFTE